MSGPPRKGRDLLSKLRELTAPLKAPSGTVGAIPTPIVVRILFDAMGTRTGSRPRSSGSTGGGSAGDAADVPGHRPLADGGAVLSGPREVSVPAPFGLEATTDRSASIQMISGPAWLALYPSCTSEEAFELFVRLGGDENTGLLEVSKLVSHYLVGAGVPVGEADLQEMVGAEEVVSLEHFVALFATHTFEAEDQLGPSPSEEGGGGGGGGDDDALDGL